MLDQPGGPQKQKESHPVLKDIDLGDFGLQKKIAPLTHNQAPMNNQMNGMGF